MMRFSSLQLFGAIFIFVVTSIAVGAGYLWLVLGSVEVGLPVAALKQHRELSNTIQSLSGLVVSIDELRIERSSQRHEELQLALDIAYAVTLQLHKGIRPEEGNGLRVVTTEALATLDMMDADLAGIDNNQLLAMYTRLHDVLAAYTEHYLRLNDRAIRDLSHQVGQVSKLRGGTVIATVLIILGLLGMFWLAWLQRQTINLLRKTENELKEARDAAQQANLVKSNFLASMSHEIRTPMNAILGMSYLTLKTDLNPIQYNYLKKVQSAANALLGIVNDILDFSRIESGKLGVESVEFDLVTVLEQLIDVVGSRAEQHGIEFLVRESANLPRTLIGDPMRLGQILINLCGNGVKFTDEGEVELSITQEAQHEGEVVLRFCVRDSGIGISETQQEKLFHKFSQVDQSATRRHGGTGLGLAISQQLTQLMGGRIWLEESAQDIGSTFCISLPLGVSHEAEKSHQRMLEMMIPRFSGLHALIVDDNKVARQVLCDMLGEFQFKVKTVRNGEAALAELRSPTEGERYDLVLMDWKMPGMLGDEATERIRRDEGIQPKPKVILVTAYGREEVIRAAEGAGVDGFLLKPVTPSTLLDAIRAVLKWDVTELVKKPQTKAEKEVLSTSFRGARVLLVEDNEINREFATELLVSLGIKVDHASNGKAAIARVQQHNYDAVLMDIQMPVMDGHESTRRIRSLAEQPGGERFAAMPIIAMTAQALVGDREAALQVGMNDYIAKPIDPPQLIDLLKAWLGSQELVVEGEAQTTDACALFSLPEDLQQMSCIDAGQGLRRMACNESAYRKVLFRFHEHHAGSIRGLRDLIERGHIPEAERFCHAIKGVVGNLGADRLFELTDELDGYLKEGERPPEERLCEFEQQLQQLLGEIVGIIPETRAVEAVEGGEVNRVEMLVLLADLKGAVDDDLVVAQVLLERLESLAAGSEWRDSVRLVVEQVEAFDVDGAKLLIKRLEERLV